MIQVRSWTFNVVADASAGEIVCLIGSSKELGNWDPCSIIPLIKKDECPSEDDNSFQADQKSIWTLTKQLSMKKVEYRYCIAISSRPDNPAHGNYVIKRWETHFTPRQLSANAVQDKESSSVETFGFYCGLNRIESGWLVVESAVQLKLSFSTIHGHPVVLWKKKHENKPVRVKVTPIMLDSATSSIAEDTTELGESRLTNPASSWPLVEVSVLKEGECCYSLQGQFGVLFNEIDFTVFQCRTISVEKTAYMFDFYLEERAGEIPHFIGCTHVLPSNLKESVGNATLPITSPKHLPIGQLHVDYLVVRPMPKGHSDMSMSFTRYWKDSWKGLEVGHRGAGNSFHAETKSCATIRENTIASFKHAAINGADMVEIDVQLSRDKIPVIYHDFHACIALRKKREQGHSDLLELPIKDLTLQQLQALKLFHVKEKGLSKFMDEDFEDHQPFPTLEQALESIPLSCGLNIEIKWTMLLENGSYELNHPFDLNEYLDRILKVVFEHAGKRKIVFSSFHPDVCSMLRLKQNRYPTIFLTIGKSKLYPAYDDLRTQSTRAAVAFAKSADILGICPHSSELLNDPNLMDHALSNNIIVFCWGDTNNDPNTITFLKNIGLHAIIYDKIDVYNCKDTKESIFLCEAKDSLKLEDCSEGANSSVFPSGSVTTDSPDSSPASSFSPGSTTSSSPTGCHSPSV